jgi:hypothetical protein
LKLRLRVVALVCVRAFKELFLTEHFVEQMFVFQRSSTFFCLEVTIKLFTVVISNLTEKQVHLSLPATSTLLIFLGKIEAYPSTALRDSTVTLSSGLCP